MDMFAVIWGLTCAALGTLLVVAACLVLPVGWLWMLVDALLREPRDYPGQGTDPNEKLVWVLLIAFVHVSALVYFFMVFVKSGRRASVAPAV